MHSIRISGIIALCGLGASCATKPVPSDVTRHSTYAIVQQIRCEARDAIRAFALNSIEVNNPQLAQQLKQNPDGFIGIDLSRFDAETRRVLSRYDQAAIGYDFTFDITETNKSGVALGLWRGFSRGPLMIGFDASNDLERQNTRTFRNADTFLYLATQFPNRFCKEVKKGTNLQYPISGTVGIRESIATFLSLNQSANLVGSASNPDLPSMIDTIEFTTTISSSLSPAVVLAPTGTELQVVSGGITFSGTRKDRHKLVLGLSLPFDPADGRAPNELIAVRRTLDAIAEQKRDAREEKKAKALDLLIN
jgi:hypothetical protein